MNEDCLKLTAYLGERDRTEHDLLANHLLDLYEQHAVQSSILMRGIAGFGLKHGMHTDVSLTLSEDLPVVAVAIDTRERIDVLLPGILAMKQHPGLLTLERARLLTGTTEPIELPEDLTEATKLTLYVGRQERTGRTPLFVAICDLLNRRGVSGATVLLGVDGTRHGARERAAFFGRNAEVPMMIISVGPGKQIANVLPELRQLVTEPIATLERVRVCKRDGQLLAQPSELPGTDEHGLALWQKLMIHSSESAQYDGQPLHRALIGRLRAANVAGATTVRGIWGFHGDHPPHGDKLLQLRRHVPTITIVIDRPERIAEAFTIVDEVTAERGLVTSEMVPAAATRTEERVRGGLRLARHRY
jgi:PII-like signaling protein